MSNELRSGLRTSALRGVDGGGPPRVFEIVDAQSWVELVANYPLEVTLSRRHDWWRATGVESSWLIPDYAAISRDYDAVHLTAHAYLTSAGVLPRRRWSLSALDEVVRRMAPHVEADVA